MKTCEFLCIRNGIGQFVLINFDHEKDERWAYDSKSRDHKYAMVYVTKEIMLIFNSIVRCVQYKFKNIYVYPTMCTYYMYKRKNITQLLYCDTTMK